MLAVGVEFESVGMEVERLAGRVGVGTLTLGVEFGILTVEVRMVAR